MVYEAVLEELRKVKPDTLTMGQLKGRLLETHPDVSGEEILLALDVGRIGGLIVETQVGMGRSEWRAT